MNRHLAEFRVIVVTGPQRSGTTIAARIIAADTSFRYIDEDEYGTRNEVAWLDMIRECSNVVIHSPAMSHILTRIRLPDVAVIWMVRPLAEILASQARIGWKDTDERRKYAYYGPAPIAAVKLHFWRVHQSGDIPWGIELAYHDSSLKDHPLFAQPRQRQAFTARQWRVEQ